MTPDLFRYADKTLTVIEYRGSTVFLAREVGNALGYSDEGGAFVDAVTRDWASELPAGTHVLKLEGQELAALKAALDYPGNPRVVAERTRHLTLLTEPGLYRSLMLAGGPVATKFRDWLDTDVLPTLRKTGSYALPTAPARPLLPMPPEGPLAELPARTWMALVSAEAALGAESADLRAALARVETRGDGIDWKRRHDRLLRRVEAAEARNVEQGAELARTREAAAAERAAAERWRGALAAAQRSMSGDDPEAWRAVDARIAGIHRHVRAILSIAELWRKRRMHDDDFEELARLLHTGDGVFHDDHPRQLCVRLTETVRRVRHHRLVWTLGDVNAVLDQADGLLRRLCVRIAETRGVEVPLPVPVTGSQGSPDP